MLNKTQIFAHRGANREAAENTRTAFNLALNNDINGIETDIQLSRDGVAVLWHDDDLSRLSLPNKHVDDFDYAELKNINFAALFSPTDAFESVMCLQEFIQQYRSRARLLLEIKNRAEETPARIQLKVQHTLAEVGAQYGDEIIISSFCLASLIYTHQCRPLFPLIYNMESYQTLDELEDVLKTQPFLAGYCLHISLLTNHVVKLLRHHNKLIAVYTCNSNAEIQHALKLQVDILISDLPNIALQEREKTSI